MFFFVVVVAVGQIMDKLCNSLGAYKMGKNVRGVIALEGGVI